MVIESVFLYPGQAARLLGVGTTKFYELNKLSDFPKPRNSLGKRVMYIRHELEEWANNLPPYEKNSEKCLSNTPN